MTVAVAFCVRWFICGVERHVVIALIPSLLMIVWFASCTGFYEYEDSHINSLKIISVVWLVAYFFAYAYVQGHLSGMEISALFMWCLITLLFLLAMSLGYYDYSDNQFSAHFRNRNNYAVATCVLLYLYLLSNRKFNFFSSILFIFLSGIVIYTRSLTGLIFLTFIAWAFLIRKQFMTRCFLIALSPFLFLLVLLSFDGVSDRINSAYYSIVEPEKVHIASSGRARLHIAKAGLEIFYNNPVIGVGVHNSKEYIKPNFGTNQYDGYRGYDTHNNYLELAISGGLLPVLLFYLPLMLSSFVFFRRKDHVSFLGCCVLISISFVTRLFEFFPLMFIYYVLLLKSLKHRG